MTISGFVAYVKQLWKNKPDISTPLSAARLTHMEDGIKGNSDAIEKIVAAVVNQITNDPDKIASMAALYAVKQQVDQQNSELTKCKKYTFDIEISTGSSARHPIALDSGMGARVITVAKRRSWPTAKWGENGISAIADMCYFEISGDNLFVSFCTTVTQKYNITIDVLYK